MKLGYIRHSTSPSLRFEMFQDRISILAISNAGYEQDIRSIGL